MLQNFAAQAGYTASDIIGEKFGGSINDKNDKNGKYSYLLPFMKPGRSGQVEDEEFLKDIAPVFEEEDFAASEGTYGEILPSSLRRIVQEMDLIKLGPDDVFYDLGSGTGKVVAQFK